MIMKYKTHLIHSKMLHRSEFVNGKDVVTKIHIINVIMRCIGKISRHIIAIIYIQN